MSTCSILLQLPMKQLVHISHTRVIQLKITHESCTSIYGQLNFPPKYKFKPNFVSGSKVTYPAKKAERAGEKPRACNHVPKAGLPRPRGRRNRKSTSTVKNRWDFDIRLHAHMNPDIRCVSPPSLTMSFNTMSCFKYHVLLLGQA